MSHFIIFLFSDFSFGILMDTDSAGLPEFFPIRALHSASSLSFKMKILKKNLIKNKM